jgi:hypothetical protein
LAATKCKPIALMSDPLSPLVATRGDDHARLGSQNSQPDDAC